MRFFARVVLEPCHWFLLIVGCYRLVFSPSVHPWISLRAMLFWCSLPIHITAALMLLDAQALIYNTGSEQFWRKSRLVAVYIKLLWRHSLSYTGSSYIPTNAITLSLSSSHSWARRSVSDWDMRPCEYVLLLRACIIRAPMFSTPVIRTWNSSLDFHRSWSVSWAAIEVSSSVLLLI